MSPDARVEVLEGGEPAHAVDAGRGKTKNRYNKMEWAGAFGDIGTLIPFVVAYITIVKVEPLGLLFMFGICLLASGFYYRTPLPVQPMKAIGAAAIAGGISPAALFGSGITTGIFWFFAGTTGAIKPDSKTCDQTGCKGHHAGAGSFLHGRWGPSHAICAGPGRYRPRRHLPSSDQPQSPGDVCAVIDRGRVGGHHEPCRYCTNLPRSISVSSCLFLLSLRLPGMISLSGPCFSRSHKYRLLLETR